MKKTDALDEARAIVEADRQRRADECWQEIQKAIKPILQKHRCGIGVSVVVQGLRLLESSIKVFTLD